MALNVKDPILSRFRQMVGYSFEYSHHKDEYKQCMRKRSHKKYKKTLRTHRIGK